MVTISFELPPNGSHYNLDEKAKGGRGLHVTIKVYNDLWR